MTAIANRFTALLALGACAFTEHCQRDYLTLVVADMWDWFEDKLARA